jgi:hypothetical protein
VLAAFGATSKLHSSVLLRTFQSPAGTNEQKTFESGRNCVVIDGGRNFGSVCWPWLAVQATSLAEISGWMWLLGRFRQSGRPRRPAWFAFLVRRELRRCLGSQIGWRPPLVSRCTEFPEGTKFVAQKSWNGLSIPVHGGHAAVQKRWNQPTHPVDRKLRSPRPAKQHVVAPVLQLAATLFQEISPVRYHSSDKNPSLFVSTWRACAELPRIIGSM